MSWVRRSRVALALGFVSFLVFAATASRGLVSMDVESAELSSWHVATTGSPWIDDTKLPTFLQDSPIRSIWVQEAHGHRVVVRSPGVVAAALPAYWLAQPDHLTVVPGAVTAALLSALTLVLMFLALRTRVSERLALGGTLVMGFATPFWAVSANGMWPHTVTILGLAGLAWAASVNRWWAAGVFGAVAMWGRLHAGIIVALFGILVGLRRRQLGITVRVGAVCLAGLVLMAWWTHWMYGSWNPRASYGATDLTDNSTMFSLVNQLGVWVSPGRGLLVWTPLILVLAPAVAREWRHLPDWSRALATGTVVYTVVQGSMQTFTGGDGFYAYRYGLEIVAAWTPIFTFSLHRAGPVARRLVLPVVALQLVAMVPGALLERPYLDQGRAWVENDLVDLLGGGGPAAFVMAALLVLGVWAVLHRLAGPGRPDLASGPPPAALTLAAER
jgi:hypothetical protein